MTNQPQKRRYSFRYFVYDFIKVTGGIPGLIWHRPKIQYASAEAKKRIKGGALLISNHVGFLDPVYMMYAVWYRRQRFICLKEIFEGKAGWLVKYFLCIPIDRENFGMESFREITGHLKNGEVVSMFPEGHINGDGSQMHTFKSGMVLMAVKSGVPIIPMYIKEAERWYQRLRIIIGEPVDIKKLYGDKPSFKQIEEITHLLFQREEELKHKLEQGD